MRKIEHDRTYQNIVHDILENEEFNRLRYIEHHGTTRYAHSMRVSYYSYKISKLLHLDIEDVARAGLLHDFFFSDQDRTTKERFLSTFNHPKKACANAMQYFGLNEREQDIIVSHMFPVNIQVPKYAESWVVSLTDKVVGFYEMGIKARYKTAYLANICMLFLINVVK